MANPFEFVESVSYTKKDLLRDEPEREKEYNAFVVNRALSYHSDSILYANEMNCNPELDPRCQYDYLLHTLRPRSRRSRWHKKAEEEQKLIEMVGEVMGLSPRKAREILPLLTAEQRESLMQSHGGTEMVR